MITGYPITVVTVDDMENLLFKFKWTYGIAIAKNHFFCEKETDATLRCGEKIRAESEARAQILSKRSACLTYNCLEAFAQRSYRRTLSIMTSSSHKQEMRNQIVYFCFSRYCNACLKSSVLRVGVKTFHNAIHHTFELYLYSRMIHRCLEFFFSVIRKLSAIWHHRLMHW